MGGYKVYTISMRNKQVKVTSYYRGVKTRKIYLHSTWYERLWINIKRGLWYGFSCTVAMAMVVVVALVYHQMNLPKVVSSAHAQEVKKINVPPILLAIADCETGDRLPNGKAVKGTARQYGKSGQVLMTGNTNKSVDVGKFAINSTNYKLATKLGYDLTTEEGNTKMALYLHKKNGVQDWRFSASCWRS